MTPITSLDAGSQIIASWIMYTLALVTITLPVIVTLAFLELISDRGSLSRAYTIKIVNSDLGVSSARDVSKI